MLSIWYRKVTENFKCIVLAIIILWVFMTILTTKYKYYKGYKKYNQGLRILRVHLIQRSLKLNLVGQDGHI